MLTNKKLLFNMYKNLQSFHFVQCINFKLPILGTVEPKTNRSKTSMLTKRIPVKGPFLANVPLQQMMQNCDGINFNRQSLDKVCL